MSTIGARTTPSFRLDFLRTQCVDVCAAVLALVAVYSLTGCQAIQSAGSGTLSEPAAITGIVHGGQQPIAGAAIQLYAAGTSGDGSAATPLLTSSVTTTSYGTFGLTGLYTCPSAATEVYLVATGGNPGITTGSTNPQIALMTALGPCGNLSATTRVEINEVTTVAGAFALAPYMQSFAKAGSNTTDFPMMADAFTMAAELANTGTGGTPGVGVPTGQVVPSQKLNTLAGIVSACINSTGGVAGDSSSCGQLFSLVSVGSSSAPTDAIGALLDIAQKPTSNVASIFNLGPPSTPFQPALASAPVDWTLEITSSTPTPVLSPSPGTYATSPLITLSDSNSSAAIYYTMDGSTPTSSSIPYTGAFVLSGTTTIRAVAIAAGISSVLTAGTYAVAAPTIALTPASVTLSSSQTQAFAATITGTSNTTVIWSLSPTIGSISATGLYTAPASITSAQTISVTATSAADTSVSASSNVALIAPVDLPSVTAGSADAFVGSVGLNVHFDYIGTIYTSQTPMLLSAISQLSIRHLRDQLIWEGSSPSGSPFYLTHQQLATMGVKTDFQLNSISQPMSQVAAFPSLVNDMEAAEPWNEDDISGGSTWVADITAQETQLYAQIHGTPATQNMTVIAPSLGQPENAPLLGNISSIADVGNSHAYFQGWNPGNDGNGKNNTNYFITKAKINVPSKPVWVTETGFWSQQVQYWGGAGNGEALMATYMPRALLDFWNSGAQRTYIYELADFESDDYFGLIRIDGTFKPAFYAVANLLSLLKEPGASFTPGALSYSLTGSTAQVDQTLLQKSDGSFYLVLWVEASGMNVTTLANIAVPNQNVIVNLGTSPASVTQYQWDSTGSMTTQALTASQAIDVSVGPNITVFRIK